MTVLESFVSFAQRLPADRLESIEAVLATLMASHDEAGAFTSGELSELDRRLAEPKPRYAEQSAVDGLLGRPPRA